MSNKTQGDDPAAMDEVVAQDHVQKRVAKLAASKHAEKHLFLLMDDSAIPFAVFYGLAQRDVTPPTSPLLPAPVTHLWLLVTMAPWLYLVTNSGLTRFDRAGSSHEVNEQAAD